MPKPPKLNRYLVAVTEINRLVYSIDAEDVPASLTMFECLRLTGALPNPRRTPLGRIESPEQVLNEDGKLLYQNTPPPDDAERMLFLEMWRRMRLALPECWPAVITAVEFIAITKGWDRSELLREVLNG